MIRRMVLTTGRRNVRALRSLRFLALLPVSLLLGHEAVLAIQYGLGSDFAAAMTAGGHDAYWLAFSVVIAALTLGVLARDGARLIALRLGLRRAPTADAAGVGDHGPTPSDGVPAGPSWRDEFR